MIAIAAAIVLLVSLTLIAVSVGQFIKNRNARPQWTRTYSRAEVAKWNTNSR